MVNNSNELSHSDHGTVVAPDEVALVANAIGEIRLLLPNYGDNEVPRIAQLLAAVALRTSDDEWVDEMLADLEEPN